MNSKVKKLILTNLPYLFIALLATKSGLAWRLAAGADFSGKVLHLLDGFAAAFQTIAPSFHPIDLCVGVAAAGAIRLAVYIKGKNAKKFRKNICKHNMTECAGRERQQEPEPPDTETPPEDEGESSPISAIAIVLLILAIGGVAVWYFKFRKPKDSGKGKNPLDDYGFDDEDEDYETEDDALPEPEEAEETEREDE